jgi:transcriptional antiterminator RfaH
MNDFHQGWYVLYTKPRHEKKVSEKIAQCRLTYFLPTIKSLRTWCDRKKFIEVPMFPSYIFVYLHNVEEYYMGLHIDGVFKYVKTGKQIARVSENIIKNIGLLVSGNNQVEVTTEQFEPGRSLVIRYGPLTNLSCEIVSVANGSQKILVRVNLLQRNLLVTLPVKYLQS